MKRVGGLWEPLVALPHLFTCAHEAARGKRKRPDVAAFLFDLETEVVRLRRELTTGAYQPGEYRTFRVLDPKPRVIAAAPFRDRVVHHALTSVLGPIFERRFVDQSYACRRGYGTHRALAAARDACRKSEYVMKCDVVKYFASIDHEILQDQLAKVVKCKQTLALAKQVIGHGDFDSEAIQYFPGDHLFTPLERRRGLPLGNQTSQFFANVYLNWFDHSVLRTLQPAAYMRYVDDFLLFGNSRKEMERQRQFLIDALAALRLRIHPRKSEIRPCRSGVRFLGWHVFPDRMRLVRPNVVRFRRTMRMLQWSHQAGLLTWGDMQPRVQAWIAHASHGNTWKLREKLFEEYAF